MENNNINNTDVNITEEVQEKKEDLKIIKLKPSQLEILKQYKTHMDTYILGMPFGKLLRHKKQSEIY